MAFDIFNKPKKPTKYYAYKIVDKNITPEYVEQLRQELENRYAGNVCFIDANSLITKLTPLNTRWQRFKYNIRCLFEKVRTNDWSCE